MRAIDDKIVCTIEEASEKQGQIIAPEHSKSGRNSTVAVVVAVGPGRLLECGDRNNVDVNVGDRIVVSRHSTAVRIDGIIYLVAEAIDVLCVLDKDQQLDVFQ